MLAQKAIEAFSFFCKRTNHIQIFLALCYHCSMDFQAIYKFIFESYAGLALLIGVALVCSIIAAALLEVKTRRLYYNHEPEEEKDKWSLDENEDEDEDTDDDDDSEDEDDEKDKGISKKSTDKQIDICAPRKLQSLSKGVSK